MKYSHPLPIQVNEWILEYVRSAEAGHYDIQYSAPLGPSSAVHIKAHVNVDDLPAFFALMDNDA